MRTGIGNCGEDSEGFDILAAFVFTMLKTLEFDLARCIGLLSRINILLTRLFGLAHIGRATWVVVIRPARDST